MKNEIAPDGLAKPIAHRPVVAAQLTRYKPIPPRSDDQSRRDTIRSSGRHSGIQ